MTVYKLDPLTDPRWPAFLSAHPESSIFHTAGWLRALHLSYRYSPIAFTTAQGDSLSNALVFCEVRSWLTGRRLISLPFSDHCQPLAVGRDLSEILEYLQQSRITHGWKYIELRPAKNNPLSPAQHCYADSERFSFQTIDLRPNLAAIYQRFHSSCIRRKIKRAEREGLVYEAGTSDDLLRKFGYLLLLTRRRHKLPPQPASWFNNIVRSLGPAVTVHLLSKDSVPIASMLTLTHKATLVYKYGCSDGHFNPLGGVPLLFWKVIQQAHEAGIETFDLGRSGNEDPGLIAFKEHLGAETSSLTYYRSPAPHTQEIKSPNMVSALARHAVSHLPDPLFAGVGQLLYRHMA
ncbi:GNAT family N-acetyltransferase [Edaphobacter paludis]|uniref:GNAT family N-acetyltransferase n=1 Tax=Edaphobacter paludis TaxID=3035702 RepID=A0AAU7CU84_9BACT